MQLFIDQTVTEMGLTHSTCHSQLYRTVYLHTLRFKVPKVPILGHWLSSLEKAKKLIGPSCMETTFYTSHGSALGVTRCGVYTTPLVQPRAGYVFAPRALFWPAGGTREGEGCHTQPFIDL